MPQGACGASTEGAQTWPAPCGRDSEWPPAGALGEDWGGQSKVKDAFGAYWPTYS